MINFQNAKKIFRTNHSKLVIVLIVSVIVSACIQQQQEIKELRIPGHPQIYSFSNDLRETLKVPVHGKAEIQRLFLTSDSIDVVFNGTSTKDNAYFTIVALNTVSKLQTYSFNEGKALNFRSFYFVEGKWYNSTNEEIDEPQLGTTIWMKGPETGANETSVSVEENIITIQGTSYKGLTLAGDRLVLIAFGVENI